MTNPIVAPETGAAIQCRGVTKEFVSGNNRTLALRGVDLEVFYGQLTFLVGPSGCGKTTLLSVMAGLLEPTGGHLNVLDHDLHQLRGSRRILFRRRNIGFVFQQYNLLPSLTAAENAAVPLLAAGVPRKEAVRRGAAMLSELGLADRTNNRPNQLSGGQQQRVAIARSLVHEPRLLVCDEPTSALDGQTGYHVMELLRNAAVRPGRAVLVVTHDSRIYQFADRIAHMNDGVITHIDSSGGNATFESGASK